MVQNVIPPRESSIASRLIADFRRARAKSLEALVRTALLRAWPLSIPTRYYYLWRRRPKTWQRINRRSTHFFAQHATPLNEYQNSAIENLRKDGIYVSSIEKLLPGTFPLHRLQKDAEKLIARPEIEAQVVRRRSKDGAKWYVIRAFGMSPTLPVTENLAQVFLNDQLLGIVNEYLGLSCRLIYLDAWYNLPANDSEPRIDSEYWHRDNEDIKNVKLFIYLNDVDENNGAFMFLRGTQLGGQYASVFPANFPEGSYPNENVLLRTVPEDQLLRCTGSAGTVILCDTIGFHRGGRCTKKPRFLLTATYASDAAVQFWRYYLNHKEQLARLSPIARYAIRALSPTDLSTKPPGFVPPKFLRP